MANKRKKGGGYIFQSTPSVWRETFCCTAQIYCLVFQSTPSVWRETIVDIRTRDPLVFQSTPSVWRETSSSCATGNQKDISIHSLRVEGDAFGSVLVYTLSNFNPLPPCGGRPRQ